MHKSKTDEDLDVKEKPFDVSAEEKCKQQNRIHQLAFKAREKMPKDYKSFCMVAAHLTKNAHRYWNLDPEEAKRIRTEAEQEVSRKIVDVSTMKEKESCSEANKVLREIHT